MQSNQQTTKNNANYRLNICRLFILCFVLLSVFIILQICSSAALSKQDNYVVAITQIIDHTSLDQARKGVMDILQKNNYKIGDNLKVIYKSAQGSITNASLIAKNFISQTPDAIVSISTQSTQSFMNSIQDTNIPLVFSSVTDPIGSNILTNQDTGVVSNLITGSVDQPLVDEEIELIETLLPNVKTIGLIYNVAESNSVKTIKLIKRAGQNKFKYIDVQLTNSNEIIQSFSSLIGNVDAIYIPSDNTVFSALPKLVQLSKKYKIPLFSSDPDSVKQGVLACVGYTQYDVGENSWKIIS